MASTRIFGIPGTHNLEIYRHLPRTGIRAITPRHEQGAGYAAEAYARVTGRPGVVVTTSGPGLTNMMTAASTAYAESQPMLVLSSGLPTGSRGRRPRPAARGQELTGRNGSAGSVEPPGAQRRRGGRGGDRGVRQLSPEAGRGPCTSRCPIDVLEQSWSGTTARPRRKPLHRRLIRTAVRRAAEVLAAAAHPMIIAGGGAVDAQAEADRAGRGARRAGRHHGQRQGRGRRGAPAVGRCLGPAAGAAEGGRRQRRAACGRHRVGRFGPVGRARFAAGR